MKGLDYENAGPKCVGMGGMVVIVQCGGMGGANHFSFDEIHDHDGTRCARDCV